MKFFYMVLCLLAVLSRASISVGALAHFPSNLDPVQKLYVVFNISNKSLISAYLDIIKEKNESLQPNKIYLEILVAPDQNVEVENLIQSKGWSNSGQYVQVTVHDSIGSDQVGGSDDWLQDAGEFFYGEGGTRPSFLYFLDSSEKFPPGWRNFWQILPKSEFDLVQVEGEGVDSSTEGGNIEATPGGSVYFATHLHSKLKRKIESLVRPEKVVPLDSSHSSVGHVDESWQYLPATKESSNGCGYVLAQTDYLDGLRLAMTFGLLNSEDEAMDAKNNRMVGIEEYKDAIAYFTGLETKEVQFSQQQHFDKLMNAFDFKRKLRSFASFYGHRKEDIYVYKTFDVQRRIFAGTEALRARAKDEGCNKLKVVSVPSFWTFGFNQDIHPFSPDDKEYEAWLKQKVPISNLTAFTNWVVVNDVLVIPDARAPDSLLKLHSAQEFTAIGGKLKEILSERLRSVGFQEKNIRFVDLATSILGDGAAHCKTSILRR